MDRLIGQSGIGNALAAQSVIGNRQTNACGSTQQPVNGGTNVRVQGTTCGAGQILYSPQRTSSGLGQYHPQNGQNRLTEWGKSGRASLSTEQSLIPLQNPVVPSAMEKSQESSSTASATVPEPVAASTPINTTAQSNLLPTNGNLISLNASSQIPFKLAKNGGNYASWKSQMTNLLFGYGLLGFADGTHPCPTKTDPGYSLWTRQDRLVLLGIQATVNSAICPMINNCTTSADAWNKLETSYANSSNTRMLSIMSSLMSNKKEGKTVATYMSNVKGLVDELALIGHPLNDAQIISYTLNGLGDEFKELTAAVRVRDTPISFEDLYDKLLDEELISNQGVPHEDEVQVTAQLTQKRSIYRGRGGRGGHRSGYNNTTHRFDSNISGQNSQSHHLQFNRQQPSYGRGKHLDNFQAPTDDSSDSIVSPSSPPHLIPTSSTRCPSITQQVTSTPVSPQPASRSSPSQFPLHDVTISTNLPSPPPMVPPIRLYLSNHLA
ncbi:unnamed protein product [Fraxinus pennsylvanica]|uniref:Retrotransposon Copia-like N-terminal domain-containing protein n=1 Tax=Fraxinus pennsylvanica TaxID=56036 RepID=A0AAD1ZCA7_9LAMI|nr:unnamed protein product [Fraxinus pennsylvanica]